MRYCDVRQIMRPTLKEGTVRDTYKGSAIRVRDSVSGEAYYYAQVFTDPGIAAAFAQKVRDTLRGKESKRLIELLTPDKWLTIDQVRAQTSKESELVAALPV